MQIEMDAIKGIAKGSSAPDAGHSEKKQRRRAQANGGGAGADDEAPTAILFLLFEGIRFSLGMYSPNRVAALEVTVLAMP